MLKTGGSLYLACVTIIKKLGLGGNDVIDAKCSGDRFSDEAVSRGDDEKLIAATGELIDAIWERVCDLEGRPLKAANVLIADLAAKIDKAA